VSASSAQVPRQRPGDDVPAAVVLATVGTDVHHFDRVLGWLERWHAGRAGGARLVVQHGHSGAPAVPGAVAFLGHDDLQRAMADATLVVSHGGPASITEARRHGHLPIVVPRDPAFGEHVDNHQQLFARRLAAAGMVLLCESEVELHDALDKGVADPSAFALAADPRVGEARSRAVAEVGRIVEELVGQRRRRGWRR
jgi:UDP-N-acetylglucosamine transferase subunit ALG13